MKISKFLENKANPVKKETSGADGGDTKEEKEISIDELLKSEEDAEIEFIFNQNPVDHITTFAQISNMEPLEKEKKENSQIQMAQKMLGGQHDFRTIYFRMKDK